MPYTLNRWPYDSQFNNVDCLGTIKIIHKSAGSYFNNVSIPGVILLMWDILDQHKLFWL